MNSQITHQKSYYKYKALDNFEFLLDILLKERLYAARYNELNDPMEGVIKIKNCNIHNADKEWEKLIKEFRIVCFSRKHNDTLMWSHYADGERGCVIEFELFDEYKCKNICYKDKPIITYDDMSDKSAQKNLFYKQPTWSYEAESRVLLNKEKTFLPIKVISVTFGSRANKQRVDLLKHILSQCKPNLKVINKSEHSILQVPETLTTESKCHMISNTECNACKERVFVQESFVEASKYFLLRSGIHSEFQISHMMRFKLTSG